MFKVNKKENDEGYVYVSFGDECNEECNLSINSLLTICPQANITVFTDSFKHHRTNILNVERLGCPYITKLFYMSKSPYNKTCYLDTDTYFLNDCSDGFKLLNYFDACMTPAPGEANIIIDDLPIEGTHPYNSGVFFFNRSVCSVLNMAHNDYITKKKVAIRSIPCEYCNGCVGDQPYIFRSLITNNCKLHSLPNTWNFRVPFHMNLNGYVRIVHGNKNQLKNLTFKTLAEILNKTDNPRMWDAINQKII